MFQIKMPATIKILCCLKIGIPIFLSSNLRAFYFFKKSAGQIFLFVFLF